MQRCISCKIEIAHFFRIHKIKYLGNIQIENSANSQATKIAMHNFPTVFKFQQTFPSKFERISRTSNNKKAVIKFDSIYSLLHSHMVVVLFVFTAFYIVNSEAKYLLSRGSASAEIGDEQNSPVFDKRSNAELINGLIGMDLGRLNAMGKRSASTEYVGFDGGGARNAEELHQMDANHFRLFGKRSNAELINGLIGMDLDRLSAMGRRRRR